MNADEVALLIAARRTYKVVTPPAVAIQHSDEICQTRNQQVLDAVAAAGWAPFHYDRGVAGIAEPWRVHVLWQDRCRELATGFRGMFPDVKPSNKLPAMLSACGALVIVNWLPQFSHQAAESISSEQAESADKRLQIDEEHLAATSAFVQNLLLMLTAGGLGSYWSSGGQFRLPKMFEHLSIPSDERLLAAVFVDYDPDAAETIERLPGKLREQRSSSQAWLREIS